jgi:hypothetical protein
MLPALILGAAMLAATPTKRPNMPKGWTWPPSTAMQQLGKRCLADLDAAKVEYRKAPAVKKVATPIVLAKLELGGLALVPLRKRESYPMDCHFAVAVLAIAPALRELGIKSIRFRTLHEYRNVRKNGKTTKILSRHALGLAVDVFGFELDDGRIVEVERDWSSEAVLPAAAALIDASELFRTPLTPANDPSNHGDHVHLEAHLRIPGA